MTYLNTSRWWSTFYVQKTESNWYDLNSVQNTLTHIRNNRSQQPGKTNPPNTFYCALKILTCCCNYLLVRTHSGEHYQMFPLCSCSMLITAGFTRQLLIICAHFQCTFFFRKLSSDSISEYSCEQNVIETNALNWSQNQQPKVLVFFSFFRFSFVCVLFAGSVAGECMVRSCAVHGCGLHQWEAGHRGEHPPGNWLHKQRLVMNDPVCEVFWIPFLYLHWLNQIWLLGHFLLCVTCRLIMLYTHLGVLNYRIIVRV